MDTTLSTLLALADIADRFEGSRAARYDPNVRLLMEREQKREAEDQEARKKTESVAAERMRKEAERQIVIQQLEQQSGSEAHMRLQAFFDGRGEVNRGRDSIAAKERLFNYVFQETPTHPWTLTATNQF